MRTCDILILSLGLFGISASGEIEDKSSHKVEGNVVIELKNGEILPFPDLRITLEAIGIEEPETEIIGATDDEGYFALRHVPTGEYELKLWPSQTDTKGPIAQRINVSDQPIYSLPTIRVSWDFIRLEDHPQNLALEHITEEQWKKAERRNSNQTISGASHSLVAPRAALVLFPHLKLDFNTTRHKINMITERRRNAPSMRYLASTYEEEIAARISFNRELQLLKLDLRGYLRESPDAEIEDYIHKSRKEIVALDEISASIQAFLEGAAGPPVFSQFQDTVPPEALANLEDLVHQIDTTQSQERRSHLLTGLDRTLQRFRNYATRQLEESRSLLKHPLIKRTRLLRELLYQLDFCIRRNIEADDLSRVLLDAAREASSDR